MSLFDWLLIVAAAWFGCGAAAVGMLAAERRRQFPDLPPDHEIAHNYRIAMREMFFYGPIGLFIMLRAAARRE